MYRTCMFCKKPLGSNEVLETFPVGRRLAFDSARGRLWVVCTKCQRWNLTPLEERWEAVEDCERLFRETPMRSSTENIGIARHRGGLDLVRIGRPPRGEFAAWRYGDQFKSRYRLAALSSVGFFGLSFAFGALPIAIPTGLVMGSMSAAIAWSYMRPLAKVRVGAERSDGRPVSPDDVAVFRLRALLSMRLLPAADESGFMVEVKKGMRKAGFRGEDARRVAAALVPRLNQRGGSQRSIKLAVQEIEWSGHPDRFLSDVAGRRARSWKGSEGLVGKMPAPTRLALEMSLHEEQERRAPRRRTLDPGTGVEGSGRDRRDFGQPPPARRNGSVFRPLRRG